MVDPMVLHLVESMGTLTVVKTEDCLVSLWDNSMVSHWEVLKVM
jgi:hypothetical protein